MTTVKYINISLEVFGGIISVLLIQFLLFGKPNKSRLEWLYIRILICNACVLLSDAAAWFFKGRLDPFSVFAVPVANFLVYCFGYAIMAAFTDYFISFIRERDSSVGKTVVHVVLGITLAAILSVIISQFNHMYYVIDDHNIYQRQGFFWFSQIFGLVGMVINAVTLLRYRRCFDKKEFAVFVLHIAMPVIAISIQIFVYGIALLYIATNISVICIYIFIQAEQARRLSEKELELERSRIAVMVSQIQPHFLFNALTSIRSVCTRDAKLAAQAITELSTFLRGNMDSLTTPDLIPFERELSHVNSYLAIEKLRFKERLNVTYNIATLDFMIPPLTLQPIVENAVRHGVNKRVNGGNIIITVNQTAIDNIVIIEDDGVGFDVDKPHSGNTPHLGIQNVQIRLKSMCGGSLKIQSTLNVKTMVTITIPRKDEAL